MKISRMMRELPADYIGCRRGREARDEFPGRHGTRSSRTVRHTQREKLRGAARVVRAIRARPQARAGGNRRVAAAPSAQRGWGRPGPHSSEAEDDRPVARHLHDVGAGHAVVPRLAVRIAAESRGTRGRGRPARRSRSGRAPALRESHRRAVGPDQAQLADDAAQRRPLQRPEADVIGERAAGSRRARPRDRNRAPARQ